MPLRLCGEFDGSFFWAGLQDFSGLTGLDFNHDDPEKSCHPVKNNGWFLFNHGFHGLSRIRKRFGGPRVLSVSIRGIRG